jgi:diguanylate cyclase (GGDEF)-like protein
VSPHRRSASRLTGLFAPGQALLRRFKLVRKFAFVSLLAVLPTLWLGYGYVSGVRADVRFAERELDGVAVVEPVSRLAVVIAENERAGRDRAAANAAALLIETSAAVERFGDARVLQAWFDWRDSYVTGTAPIVDQLQRLEEIFITIGNRSNLVLDPELDSYYLMDASLLRLPELNRLVLELTPRTGSVETGNFIAKRDLARVASLQMRSLASAFAAVADNTSNDTIGTALQPLALNIEGRYQRMTQALDEDSKSTSNSVALSPAVDALPSPSEIERLWSSTLDSLRAVLTDRVADQNRAVVGFGLFAIGVFLAAGYLSVSLFAALLRKLRHIEQTLVEVGNGDLNARVPVEGSDELATVSAAINDTVDKIAAARGELSRQATIDDLTGLLNRKTFLSYLSGHLADRSRGSLALLMIDLDRFKTINDSFGHAVGDQVLRVVADRLRAAVPSDAVVARLSGDEFVALIPDCGDGDGARALADQLVRRLLEPVDLSSVGRHQTESAGGSVGLVLHDTRSNTTADELMAFVDQAMYRAKSMGRGRVCEFDDTMRAETSLRLRLRGDLADALNDPDRWGLEPAYQPIFSIADGSMIGVEALARWNHPELGSVGPNLFIPVAEDAGLVSALGRFMLGRATTDVTRWRQRVPKLHAAVNISASHLLEGSLVADSTEALNAAGGDPESLWIELTESVIMTDVSEAQRTLDSLRRLGVSLSIDDFGTGYSSMAYLQRLDATALKIDRSFVTPLAERSSRDVSMARAMIDLAHHLDLSVVAEGIENAAELDVLRELGCDLAQGFLLGRPVPATRLTELVREQSLV